MKNAMKKLLSLMLVAVLLVSAVPFKASAAGYQVTLQPNYPSAEGQAIANVYDDGRIDFNSLTATVDLSVQWVNTADGSNVTADTQYSGAAILAPKSVYDAYIASLTPDEGGETPDEDDETVTPPAPPAPQKYTVTVEVAVGPEGKEDYYRTSFEVEAGYAISLNDELITRAFPGYSASEYDRASGWTMTPSAATINANTSISIRVVKKEAAPVVPETPSTEEPTVAPTEPEINDSVDIVVGNGDKRILVTLDWNVTGMKDNYVRVTDPNTKMGTVMEAIQKSGLIPKRTNYTFAGWYWDDDFDYPVKDNEYVTDSTTTALRIYARWTRNASADNVFLKIYLNGKTSSPAKIVDISSYGDADGAIDIYEAKRAAGNYYSSTGYDGLFTDTTWNGGAYNNSDQTDSVAVNANGDTFIYIMLWGAKTTSTSSSSSSSSSGTADTSNPKTGDTVYMVMTVMGLSAAALVAVYYVSKKRAF